MVAAPLQAIFWSNVITGFLIVGIPVSQRAARSRIAVSLLSPAPLPRDRFLQFLRRWSSVCTRLRTEALCWPRGSDGTWTLVSLSLSIYLSLPRSLSLSLCLCLSSCVRAHVCARARARARGCPPRCSGGPGDPGPGTDHLPWAIARHAPADCWRPTPAARQCLRHTPVPATARHQPDVCTTSGARRLELAKRAGVACLCGGALAQARTHPTRPCVSRGPFPPPPVPRCLGAVPR